MNQPFQILIIDDDEANRYSMRRILEKSGYSVDEADTAAKGLEKTLNQPEIIILDIQLPDRNGYDVCRDIKSNPLTASIPVLQTSANFISTENKVEGLESGADGYLAQPIEPTVFVATIRSLIRTRQAEKKAQAATTARDEMMAIVSHDLRNPLAAIMLQVKLMKKTIEQKGTVPDLKDKLDRISNSCNRMNRLIQDILDVSSIEGGKFKLNPQHFSVGNMLLDTISGFEEIASNNGLELQHHIQDDDHTVYGDRERIIQILMNLISNSIKFTPKGGKIIVRALEEQGETIISVEDTGAGIASDALPHIFNRFWQGHKNHSSAGIGLGLSIVKGIVDAHNGKVSVTSTPNEGTKFTVVLPKSV